MCTVLLKHDVMENKMNISFMLCDICSFMRLGKHQKYILR